jgi:hypothetical protein
MDGRKQVYPGTSSLTKAKNHAKRGGRRQEQFPRLQFGA